MNNQELVQALESFQIKKSQLVPGFNFGTPWYLWSLIIKARKFVFRRIIL